MIVVIKISIQRPRTMCSAEHIHHDCRKQIMRFQLFLQYNKGICYELNIIRFFALGMMMEIDHRTNGFPTFAPRMMFM
ncbi:hypothetical protein ATO46_06220 [Aeromonas schubertii]|nr:hypothetical protein ATO46_06220 [Aeromonas schubertii]